MGYPYYTEGAHDEGTVATAGRNTTISSAEGRLILEVENKINLLEPKICWAFL